MERIIDISDFDGFWAEESPEDDILGTYLFSVKYDDETNEASIFREGFYGINTLKGKYYIKITDDKMDEGEWENDYISHRDHCSSIVNSTFAGVVDGYKGSLIIDMGKETVIFKNYKEEFEDYLHDKVKENLKKQGLWGV